MIKILLEHPKIDVNKTIATKFYDGVMHETPLTIAISLEQQDNEVISLLLNHTNINVNLSVKRQFGNNKYKKTPLSIALKNNKLLSKNRSYQNSEIIQKIK